MLFNIDFKKVMNNESMDEYNSKKEAHNASLVTLVDKAYVVIMWLRLQAKKQRLNQTQIITLQIVTDCRKLLKPVHMGSFVFKNFDKSR